MKVRLFFLSSTLEITLLFAGSMIMIGLGIVGQYVARIYDEVKKRPIYIVSEEVGVGMRVK